MPNTRRILTLAWILFWLLMGLTSVQEYLRGHAHGVWKPILWESSSALTATVLLLLQRRYTRQYDALIATPVRWFVRQLAWLPVYWVGFVPLAFGLRHAIYHWMGEAYQHESWLQVFLYEDIKMTLFYSLFTAITFGVLSFHAMLEERLRLERAQTALREAQLLRLSQQMQPHFLFNALNTISALMHSDVARADAMLIQLSDILRTTLAVGERHQVPLATELDLLRGYAALMTERFADRVSIRWDISPSALACAVPVMCLQPLLENVFKHTVERRRQPTAIVISAQRQPDTLLLRIEDDSGTLAAVAAQPDTGSGIGTSNLRARLTALYGTAAQLRLQALQPAGVLAELSLPCAS